MSRWISDIRQEGLSGNNLPGENGIDLSQGCKMIRISGRLAAALVVNNPPQMDFMVHVKRRR